MRLRVSRSDGVCVCIIVQCQKEANLNAKVGTLQSAEGELEKSHIALAAAAVAATAAAMADEAKSGK